MIANLYPSEVEEPNRIMWLGERSQSGERLDSQAYERPHLPWSMVVYHVPLYKVQSLLSRVTISRFGSYSYARFGQPKDLGTLASKERSWIMVSLNSVKNWADRQDKIILERALRTCRRVCVLQGEPKKTRFRGRTPEMIASGRMFANSKVARSLWT